MSKKEPKLLKGIVYPEGLPMELFIDYCEVNNLPLPEWLPHRQDLSSVVEGTANWWYKTFKGKPIPETVFWLGIDLNPSWDGWNGWTGWTYSTYGSATTASKKKY